MTSALEGGEGSASRPGRTLPPGKTRYPLYRKLGGASWPVWTGKENLALTGIRSPDRPARRQSKKSYKLLIILSLLGDRFSGFHTLSAEFCISTGFCISTSNYQNKNLTLKVQNYFTFVPKFKEFKLFHFTKLTGHLQVHGRGLFYLLTYSMQHSPS